MRKYPNGSGDRSGCMSLVIRWFLPLIVVVWLIIAYSINLTSTATTATRSGSDNKSIVDFTARPDHLVMVACHATLRLINMAGAGWDEDSWQLLDYQKGQGFPAIIKSHIERGLELTQADERAVLVFSGGETRLDSGPISEAASYYYAASIVDGEAVYKLKGRIFEEEYARDSFENLLFSLCRFKEATGAYPKRVTVVGFGFKGARFTELHREALQLPLSRFQYVGVDPDPSSPFNSERAILGEADAYDAFRTDPYGCARQELTLTAKRHVRDPFHRSVPYELACPDLKALLHWCGPGPYKGTTLPWSGSGSGTGTGTLLSYTPSSASGPTLRGPVSASASLSADDGARARARAK